MRRLGIVVLGMAALAWAAPASAQLSFSGPTNYRAGGFTAIVATADLNGDGHLDIVAANEHSDNVSVLLGDGTGSFSPARNFPAGNNPQAVTVGNFNGDTHPDLAVPDFTGGVSILFGDGTGHFSAPHSFPAGVLPIMVAVADYNRDGHQDLAVANQGSGNVSILLGDGAGHFSAPTNFPAGSGPNAILTTDFNKDGRADLAVPNRDSGDVSILLGNGAGGFTTSATLAAGTFTFQAAVGDFNEDTHRDLIVDSFFADASLFLGDGTGAFAAPTRFSAASGPNDVEVADFNGDGHDDIVFSDFNVIPPFHTSHVNVFLGDGTGAFLPPLGFATHLGSNSIAVGDFNGDHRPDLAVANLSTNDVSVLLNTSGGGPGYRETVLADHPHGYWRFDERSGSVAHDSSPFGNNGSYRNSPTLGAPGVLAGDSAVQLDGHDDFVRVPDSPSLRTDDSFSLEVWLKRRKLSTDVGTEGIFLKGYQLYLDGNGQIVLRAPLTRTIARSRTRIADTTRFHHVVATKSGNSVHVYIDGVDVTRRVGSATAVDTSGALSIGAGAGTFRGILDEAAVYGHVLTPADVARHFAAAH